MENMRLYCQTDCIQITVLQLNWIHQANPLFSLSFSFLIYKSGAKVTAFEYRV